MPPSDPTALFIHIYKTGGSALFQLLRQYAAQNSLPFLDYTTWIRAQRGLRSGGGELDLTGAEQEHLKKFRIIAGHMWYGKHRGLENFFYITMLRDASATAVSEILFDNRTGRGLPAATLPEAVRQVRAFLDDRPAQFRCDMIDRLVGRRLSESLEFRLATANQNLGTIAVVGILERLPDTLALISERLPLCSAARLSDMYRSCDRNAIPYGYTSPQVIDSLPGACAAELQNYVKFEDKLYQFARRIHDQQVAQLALRLKDSTA